MGRRFQSALCQSRIVLMTGKDPDEETYLASCTRGALDRSLRGTTRVAVTWTQGPDTNPKALQEPQRKDPLVM
jgi:hypothetical protein